MSKAVAEVIQKSVGIDVVWVDRWNKPPVGTRLYTADHAEALANSAAKLCNFLMQVGVHPLAIPRVDDLLSEIAKYREETK